MKPERNPFDFFEKLVNFDDEERADRMFSPWSGQSSSYQVHRHDDQVLVDIEVPGVPSKNLKVEVLNTASCIVQWSGQRRQRIDGETKHVPFSDRLRLGSSVECDKLAANLSHGLLTLSVPMKPKEEQQDANTGRSIPIVTVD